MDEKFDLEYQYQLYLQRVRLKEEDMHPIQRKETKQAFYGAWGQFLALLHDDFGTLGAEKAADVLDNMHKQVNEYFLMLTRSMN